MGLGDAILDKAKGYLGNMITDASGQYHDISKGAFDTYGIKHKGNFDPGFGETDFVSVIKTLKELDYQRYVSVEVFDFAPDPKTIAAGSLHYLKGIAAAL